MGANPDVAAGARPLVNEGNRCHHRHMASRALIVDDHAAFRASARRLLEVSGFQVVGEAADGPTGLRLARELEPEVVLLDIALPQMSGFDVAAELAGTSSKVILVSSRNRSDFNRRIRRSGAVGFLSKDDLSGEALAELLEATP
jgi:DNA-binding NarL/FixJ family response regulator